MAGTLVDRLPARALESRGLAARGARTFEIDPTRVWLLEAPDSVTAVRALATLAGDRAVDWAEGNAIREPLDEDPEPIPPSTPGGRSAHPFPDDPMFRDGRQWGLRNIGPYGRFRGFAVAGADVGALEGWSWSRGANDLLLAVADTGIDPGNPELQATMPDGAPRLVHAINVTSESPDSIRDSHGHGTAVTGVFGALTNNGARDDSLGVAGVCGGDGRGNLGCRIVPIKITRDHQGVATSYDIARAILHATMDAPRAMNLSFGRVTSSRVDRRARTLDDDLSGGARSRVLGRVGGESSGEGEGQREAGGREEGAHRESQSEGEKRGRRHSTLAAARTRRQTHSGLDGEVPDRAARVGPGYRAGQNSVRATRERRSSSMRPSNA
jgi:subtilisin family serine protease